MPPTKHPNKVTLVVAGAEGDVADIEVNVHERLSQVLREALKELYGDPPRDPNLYDIVIGGAVVTDLTKTVEEVGLANGAEITVLPKDVSRG